MALFPKKVYKPRYHGNRTLNFSTAGARRKIGFCVRRSS